MQSVSSKILIPHKGRLIHPMDYREVDPGNPWFPLPRDYPELTEEGQRQARIAAVCKQDTALDFVAAWDLFRRLYLMTTERGFFYHNFVESPPFHYELIGYAGMYARNLAAAPRGFAKSVIVGTELPLFLLLTRPYIRIALGLSTDKLVEQRFEVLMTQLTENPFILGDFGTLRPQKGTGIWNRHHLHTKPGAKIEGYSVTGRKRGARPDVFILDDPEYDPESESGAVLMRDKFESFLFKQVIPMLEKGSAIYWIGTIIGRRSFLAHACYGEDTRFDYWNRTVYAAESEEVEKGETASVLWEGKWDKEMLNVRRKEIGEANYASEYMNKLSSDQDKVLVIDPKLNEYTITNDDSFLSAPLSSDYTLTYWGQDKATRVWEQRKVKSGDFFTNMYRIITHDPARGLSAHHDYTCIAVLGFDQDNTLWILDMWMGRAKELMIQRQIWRLGLKWQPKLIGIESIASQIALVDSTSTYLKQQISETGQMIWTPRVIGVDYSRSAKDKSKAERISTLEWRFPTGKIKYPAHRKEHWPINMLYSQTEDFTYDLSMLPYDDAIDSIAMAHYVVHSRGIPEQEKKPVESLEQMLMQGKRHIAGAPILGAFGSAHLTEDLLNTIIDTEPPSGYNSATRGRQPLTSTRRPHVTRHRNSRRRR